MYTLSSTLCAANCKHILLIKIFLSVQLGCLVVEKKLLMLSLLPSTSVMFNREDRHWQFNRKEKSCVYGALFFHLFLAGRLFKGAATKR